jgi:hypothetical protein
MSVNTKIMNFDSHCKILNFLTYLQGIGVITEKEKDLYASYIQEHLTEREETITILKGLFNGLGN